MALYNLKQTKKELPDKTFGTEGLDEKSADATYKKALKNPKKHLIEDIYKDKKSFKKPTWFFTTEAFHFFREKGSGMANYDITIIINVTLHILARSLDEARKLLDDEIRGGDSKLLSELTDDINALLQKKNLHEQHNLSWIPPFHQEEFVHHIPSGNPSTIHVESEDSGFIEYPSDLQFIKLWVDDIKKIHIDAHRGQ